MQHQLVDPTPFYMTFKEMVLVAGFEPEEWSFLYEAEHKIRHSSRFVAIALKILKRDLTEYHKWQQMIDVGYADWDTLPAWHYVAMAERDDLIHKIEHQIQALLEYLAKIIPAPEEE